MDMENITYCGLHCGNCYLRSKVGPSAEKLKADLIKTGYDQFGPAIPGFSDFWSFLSTLAEENGCVGCRSGGGNPECGIRLCAREKGKDHCMSCGEACEKMSDMHKGYPMLKEDQDFYKQHGSRAWEEMQQKRVADGYTYTEERERRQK